MREALFCWRRQALRNGRPIAVLLLSLSFLVGLPLSVGPPLSAAAFAQPVEILTSSVLSGYKAQLTTAQRVQSQLAAYIATFEPIAARLQVMRDDREIALGLLMQNERQLVSVEIANVSAEVARVTAPLVEQKKRLEAELGRIEQEPCYPIPERIFTCSDIIANRKAPLARQIDSLSQKIGEIESAKLVEPQARLKETRARIELAKREIAGLKATVFDMNVESGHLRDDLQDSQFLSDRFSELLTEVESVVDTADTSAARSLVRLSPDPDKATKTSADAMRAADAVTHGTCPSRPM